MKKQAVLLLLAVSALLLLAETRLGLKPSKNNFIIYEPAIIGVVGYVVFYLLVQRGMIFSKYHDFLYWLLVEKLDPCRKMNLIEWIGKPLGLCEVCVTGQIAFWYYFTHWQVYSLPIHVVYFSLAIFVVHSLTEEK